jgi:Baseplate J-like protein
MGYVPFAYDGENFDDLLTDALTRIAAVLPGWTPNKTHLEYAVLSEMTRLALDTRLLASDVADAIFRSYGTSLIGIPPQPGVPASANAVFTLTDTTVHTIPAGTAVLWPTGGDPILFQTAVAVSNLAGSATTPAVQITAATVGTAANGLPAATLQLVDALSYVASVASTTTSGGGTDAETDAAYLDRLSDSLQLLRRIPVLGRDFAILARDVPGVYRAMALDGYNPADGTSNNDRMVAVAPLAADGTAVPGSVATALQARLQSEREVNFIVNTLNPTFTALTVTFTGQAETGADTTAVRDAAIQSVKDFLSPATWAGGSEHPPVWRYEPTVRYLDLARVIGSTAGMRHVYTVTLNGGTADVTLAGAAPLPAANPTVTGTVT